MTERSTVGFYCEDFIDGCRHSPDRQTGSSYARFKEMICSAKHLNDETENFIHLFQISKLNRYYVFIIQQVKM